MFAFKTTDLDGNAVDSAEFFSKAKVTMVYCWGTWCNPCKAELPELGKMAKELEEQGCQLVGLCTDAFDDAVAATAKQLLSDADASCLNLRCTSQEPPPEVCPSIVTRWELFKTLGTRLPQEKLQGEVKQKSL